MTKKKLSPPIFIEHDVYPSFSTMVVIGWKSSDIIDYINNHTTRGKENPLTERELLSLNNLTTQTGKAWMLSQGETILWLKDLPQTPYQMAVLAHESWHIADYILSRVGIEYIPEKSDEAYTYLMMHIVNSVLTKLKAKIIYG